MRKGCVFAATLLVILLAVGGYMGYTMLRDNFDVPEELAPYAEYDSMVKLIRSDAPAPPDTAHLTRERVELFIGALDPVNAGWRELCNALDSVGGKGGNHEDLNMWQSPLMFRQIFRLPLLTRQGMVSYLNSRNLSMAEYLWLKERTVAASGITYRDFADSFRAAFNKYVPLNDSVLINGNQDISKFFDRVEELRRTGRIDSADIALAAPYRDQILARGTGALLSMEREVKDVNASVTIE